MGRTKLGDLLKPLATAGTTPEQLWKRVQEWPPDLFAVTSLLLDGGRYERIVDPPKEERWPPPATSGTWEDDVKRVATSWRNELTDGHAPAKRSPLVRTWFDRRRPAFLASVARSVSELRAIPWGELSAIAELHAVADEASKGLGVPGVLGTSSVFDFRVELQLNKAGSLATFPPEVIRVVPKLHTPQRGMTLRSTSHYLGALRSPIGVRWRAAHPRMLSDESRQDRHVRLLLVPWPFEVSSKVVRPARGPRPIKNMPSKYDFFDFEPPGGLDVELVVRLLKKLQRRGDVVDGIVLPEAALTRAELQRLLKRVAQYGVGFILTGIRDTRENCAVTASPHSPQWQYAQHKHHRWCLDGNQIAQYGFDLDQGKLWWENIQLQERNVHFVAVTDWFTMCHVICEDLARLDPVDQVIRAVGPNLLVALLQDGPQLKERWASKFASVYADDPGCSVLTLTSLGMSMASRGPIRSAAISRGWTLGGSFQGQQGSRAIRRKSRNFSFYPRPVRGRVHRGWQNRPSNLLVLAISQP